MANSNLPTEEELIDKLVTRWHLNVPERASLPGGMARGSLLKAAIVNRLMKEGWFPGDWRPDDGFSGGLIERTVADFRIHWKAECGVGRFALVRVTHHPDAVDAAENLLRGMWGNDIDGVTIDWKA